MESPKTGSFKVYRLQSRGNNSIIPIVGACIWGDDCRVRIRKLDDIRIMNYIPTKASLDVRVKCKTTGCFLFLYKNDKLEKQSFIFYCA
jgi:hypothetical protein